MTVDYYNGLCLFDLSRIFNDFVVFLLELIHKL